MKNNGTTEFVLLQVTRRKCDDKETCNMPFTRRQNIHGYFLTNFIGHSLFATLFSLHMYLFFFNCYLLQITGRHHLLNSHRNHYKIWFTRKKKTQSMRLSLTQSFFLLITKYSCLLKYTNMWSNLNKDTSIYYFIPLKLMRKIRTANLLHCPNMLKKSYS